MPTGEPATIWRPIWLSSAAFSHLEHLALALWWAHGVHYTCQRNARRLTIARWQISRCGGMVYAVVSKTTALTGLRVRVPSSAPNLDRFTSPYRRQTKKQASWMYSPNQR